MNIRENLKSKKGFTLIESLLSVFIVSLALLSLTSIIGEINKVESMTKEMYFAEELITPYLSYYQDLEVTEGNRDYLLSDNSKVDLIKEAFDTTDGIVNDEKFPEMYRSLKIFCTNNPTLINNDKYIKFDITCEIGNKTLNKGKPFVIVKYIKED